jgi:putative resolvase
MEKLYTLKEAKKLLGVTTKTIQRWDREGRIRVVRTIGGRRILVGDSHLFNSLI